MPLNQFLWIGRALRNSRCRQLHIVFSQKSILPELSVSKISISSLSKYADYTNSLKKYRRNVFHTHSVENERRNTKIELSSREYSFYYVYFIAKCWENMRSKHILLIFRRLAAELLLENFDRLVCVIEFFIRDELQETSRIWKSTFHTSVE